MNFIYPAEKQSQFLQLRIEVDNLLDYVKALTQEALPPKENEIEALNQELRVADSHKSK
jgi:hypothetical protein